MSDGISTTDWPSNRSVEHRRAEIDATITLWVGNQRLDAALKAAELGALSFLQKAVVMRNGLLISCIKHCRLNPRAEAKIPILIMIMFLADNAAGICYLGVMRMAEIFQRTKTCIINNIAALEADGLIGVDRKDGMLNCYWPLIPAALAEMSANPIWFVDALSTKPKSRIFKTPDEAIAAATEDGNLSTPKDRSTAVDRSTAASEPVNSSERTGQLQRDSISSLNSSPTSGSSEGSSTQEKTDRREDKGSAYNAQRTFQTTHHGKLCKGAGWLGVLNPEVADRKAYARANVTVSRSGKVSIGSDYRAELISEGFTDGRIETGLISACKHIEGNDPEKWMRTVRTACGWAKRDDANAAKKPAPFAGRSVNSSL
jgi:hypothetical protein